MYTGNIELGYCNLRVKGGLIEDVFYKEIVIKNEGITDDLQIKLFPGGNCILQIERGIIIGVKY